MPLKLSELNPKEVETVGDVESTLGRKPTGPKLSDFHPEDIEAYEPPVPANQSPITAATTGIMQGAVPFASAIAGAGKTAMDAITGVRGPLAGGSLDDLVKDYRQARDSFQADAKTSAEANPATSFAGNIAGGLTNPLFQGATSLPKLAGAGAVQGLGVSEADLTKGELKDAAIDTGLGALGGGLGYGAGKLAGWIGGLGKKAGKKALTLFGPHEEAINARAAGKAQPNAKNYATLAEDMGATLRSLGEETQALDQEAWNTLSHEADIPKGYVVEPLNDALEKLTLQGKTIGKTDKQVQSALLELKGDLEQLGEGLSERDLKAIIRKMDDNINWDDQSADKLNTTLEKIRNQYDQSLKFKNKSYKDAMAPVAERTGLLKDLRRQFNFRNTPGEGLLPTDTTASKIQTSLRDTKAITQENLAKLKELTGQDYPALVKDYQLSQQFDKTAPNGSRRTALGAAVGGFLGHTLLPGLGIPGGAAAGAGAGAVLDRYGGAAVGSLLDSYVKAGNSQAFGKFAPVIEQAVKRGPEATAILGSILATNPEFKKILQGPGQEVPIGNRMLGSTQSRGK